MKKINTISPDLESMLDNNINSINPSSMNLPKYFNAPISLIWELTSKCNSNCIYCSGGFPRRSKELSREEKLSLADEIIDQKVFMVNLSGGDPFLCEELEELVDKFTSNNINVMICTPGINNNENLIKKFSKNPLVAFNISIDSYIPDINDLHRGVDGSLTNVTQLLDLLNISESNKTFISIEVVVTKKNLNDLEGIISFLTKFHVHEIRFQPVVALNQKTYDNDLELSQEDIETMYKKVNKLNQNKNTDRLIYIRGIDQSKAVVNGIKSGVNWGGIISPEGDLMTSVYIPFTFGNLKDYGGLKYAWKMGFNNAWKHPMIKKEFKDVKNTKDLERVYKKYNYIKQKLDLKEIKGERKL